MDTFIEGLKLTAEGMVAAFAVCALIIGVSGVIGRFFGEPRRDKPRIIPMDVDDDEEEVAVIAAVMALVMGEDAPVVEEIGFSGDGADSWARINEMDLPEGGEF